MRRQPSPSKNSFIFAKKPALSGWVLCDHSASNSASSSRWRRVRFCGVSTLSLDVEVAEIARAQHRHALAAQSQLAPRLRRPRGCATFDVAAVERAHREFAAERRLHHRDRHAAIEVGAVALEERMRLDRQENVEIARRAAAHARLALAGEADARAVLDAGRNIDRQRALARHAARAGAPVAGIVDRLAAAVAGRAGALDGEEALLRADAAVARAGLAGRRLRAGLGA